MAARGFRSATANGSAAIPDRSDRRARPARAEGAAIVMAAVEAGLTEIILLAVVAVISGRRVDVPGTAVLARQTAARVFLLVERNAVAERLVIARQEAVAVPDRLRSLCGRLCRQCRERQQRDDDDDGGRRKARHSVTVGKPPRERHSNSGATLRRRFRRIYRQATRAYLRRRRREIISRTP